MVTAIVIPILIIYFYWITKKEAVKQKQNWETLDDIKLEARIQGTIDSISVEKKRFYHQYYMMVTTLRIEDRTQSYTVIRKQPFTKAWLPMALCKGDIVQAYGQWEKDIFIAGEMKKITRNC